jgi:hypothetical protein
MKINIILGAVATLAVGSAAATTAPAGVCDSVVSGVVKVGSGSTNPDTGHFYEVYKLGSISWDEAKQCTDKLPPFIDPVSGIAIPAHLATITSSAENRWVDELRDAAFNQPPFPDPGYKGQVWLGGEEDGSGGWRWVNGEGPFPSNNLGPAYANWAAGEPNNSGGVEDHVTAGRFGLYGGWNDEGAAPGLIAGFIVEYDVPRPAACNPTNGSCQTIKGQSLIFPAGSFGTNTTIAFNGFQFKDPRVGAGTCGKAGLTLFGVAYGRPELQIPPYLCGSPDLVVVAVNGDQLNIQSGTVAIENDTNVVLPLNTVKICKDTVGPTSIVRPTPGNDPQLDDVVVYQTTDPDRMRESYSSTGVDPQFIPGAAGEFTNGCGSSRGSSKEPSYFVVGMHIDFGTTDPALVKERFVSLTLYKLSLLQQSVTAAGTAGVLKNGDTTKMTAQLNNAVRKLGRGDPSGALGHVQQFLKFVNAAKYNTPTLGSLYPPDVKNNYNGEHLMRGTNIEFTLRVKIVPNTP